MAEEHSVHGSPARGGNTSNQTEIDIILCARRAVDKTILTTCGFQLVEKPQIGKKAMIQYMGKARIIPPTDCAFVSVIMFKNTHIKRHKFEVQGLMVLYIPEDTAVILLRAMGFSREITEADIKDGCGEFLNVMAGRVKAELVKEGYEELELSSPFNFGYKVDELFDYEPKDKFELVFFREGLKFLSVDIAISTIQKFGTKPA